MADPVPAAPAAPAATKPAWKSKTLIAAAVTSILPTILQYIPYIGPPARAWILANPDGYSAVIATLFGGLRLFTSKKIS